MAAAQSGRVEESVDHARRAVAARDGPASRMALGRSLLQSGRTEEALESLRRAAADSAIAPDANFHLGQALRRLGQADEAAEALRASVEACPGHGPAWNELGVVRMSQGLPGPARDAFRRSLEARPGDAGVLCNLAISCLCLGDQEGAEAAVTAALRADPDSSRALAMRGRVERNRGRIPESMAAWERSVELDPESAEAWAGLGSVRQAAGDLEAAGHAYRRSLELAPDNADAIAGMAEWHEWQGRYREGLDLLDGIQGAPSSPGVDLVAGRLLRRVGQCEAARQRLEDAVSAAAGDALLRRQFAFSLGDVCDELGDTTAAWQWYREGNRLTPASFDPTNHRHALDQLAALAPPPRSGNAGAGIVFVVGMPRSGTTLVEQILAAHSAVAPAGELPLLGQFVRDLGSGAVEGDAGTHVGDRYLRAVSDYRRRGMLMTDKMPLNYQYLDLIGSVLPGARIVHCRRDYRDVALSCFFTDFIDPALGFATRLEWLADYLQAYDDFMRRPRPALAGRMLNLDYETLVDDTEVTVRALLDFLSLPWEPACLESEMLDRVAATASHAQVRRPIYRTSIGRWKAYEDHLGPLLQRLQR